MSAGSTLLAGFVGAIPLLAAVLPLRPVIRRLPLERPRERLAGASRWVPRVRHRGAAPSRSLVGSVRRDLPDIVDLLALCTAAGVSLSVAHSQVAHRVPEDVGAALRAAAAAAEAGRPRADALVEALGPLGDGAQRLAHVLADHLRYGTPLAPGLERLATDLRADRRRRAEQAARRTPVRLLGPLVVCLLPAFALLTVVPLLAASLRALPT